MAQSIAIPSGSEPCWCYQHPSEALAEALRMLDQPRVPTASHEPSVPSSSVQADNEAESLLRRVLLQELREAWDAYVKACGEDVAALPPAELTIQRVKLPPALTSSPLLSFADSAASPAAPACAASLPSSPTWSVQLVIPSHDRNVPPPPHLQIGAVRLPCCVERRSPSCVSSSPSTASLGHGYRSLPILVVGAGGIGCEVIKTLALHGYTNLHLVDLDTVDGTNLNRQFLFDASSIGASKSFTTRSTIMRWRVWRECSPPPTIVAYHDDIKSPRFDRAFFNTSAAVLNALDNVSARQHVNRLCCSLPHTRVLQVHNGDPVCLPPLLIESGTMGYNGQVQPIVPGYSECYDCQASSPDTESFAVCSIHARPTRMVHCIHFAKELYEVLFGTRQSEMSNRATGDDTTAAASSEVAERGESKSELAYLKEWWVDAFTQHHSTPTNEAEEAPALFHTAFALATHVFRDKIESLARMVSSSWPSGPPLSLFSLPGMPAQEEEAVRKASEAWMREVDRPTTLTTPLWALVDGSPASQEADEGAEQAQWTAFHWLQLLLLATAQCVQHRVGSHHSVPFQKEDDLSVAFVAAVSNLRALNFHLPTASVEAVRGMAGRIVPAVVTSNAIAGATMVHQLDVFLRTMWSAPPTRGPHPLLSTLLQKLSTVYIRKFPLVCRRPRVQRDGVKKLAVERYTVHCIPLDTLRVPITPEAWKASGMDGEATTVGRVCRVCHPSHRLPRLRFSGPHLSFDTCSLGTVLHILLAPPVLPSAAVFEAPTITFRERILYEAGEFEELAGMKLSELATRSAHEPHTVVGEAPGLPTYASYRPLVFVLDALNHEVEWEIELHHTDENQSEKNDDGSAGYTVEGVEEGVEQEQLILRWQAQVKAAEEKEAEALRQQRAEVVEIEDDKTDQVALKNDEVLIVDDD